MLAFSRRLALAFAALVTLLAAIAGLTATPVRAATCPSVTFGSTTLTDCSEILTVTQSGGNFNVTVSYPAANGSTFSNNGFNPNGVLIGVVNHSGVIIQDLKLIGSTGMPIFNIVPSETLCFSTLPPANCGIGGSATAPHNGATYTITGNEGKFVSGTNIVYFTSIGSGNATANNQGDIVFDGGLPANFTAYFALTNLTQAVCVTNAVGACVTTASEPGTLFLLGGGLLGLIAMRRRWFALARRRPAEGAKNHTRLYRFEGKSFCALRAAVRRSLAR